MKDVDVDGAVVIGPGLSGRGRDSKVFTASHVAFYLLGGAQQLHGCELCADAHDGIDKHIVGPEAPRLGLIES